MSEHPLLAHLRSQFDQVKTRAQALLDKAVEDDNRDLTDEETKELETLAKRKTSLEEQMEAAAVDWSINSQITDKLQALKVANDQKPFAYRSAGDLLYDMLHQSDNDSKARYQTVMKRAAEHMGTIAAETTPVAGDLAGLHVVPSVGPVIDPIPASMPFASALGLLPLPDTTFTRPIVEDPDDDTGVGVQALEKAELPSKKFDVTSVPITSDTVGGYLNISQKLLTFRAGSLELILRQMRKRLSRHIEKGVVTKAATTTTVEPLDSTADPAATLQAIYDAAATVYQMTGELAEWILMGPLGFAMIGGKTDLAGRPLFPYLGAANAPGQSNASGFTTPVAGLRAVQTWAIADTAIYVGNGEGIEGWLYQYPILEAVEPSVLGRQVAVAGELATNSPVPNAVVKLADTTP